MPTTQDEFEEIQYQELRNKVSAERVYAKLNVDYYGVKIGQLDQRLRRSNVLMFLAAASVAVTPLLAVPFGTVAVISVVVLTLVAPVTVILLRHYWSTDLLAYVRARTVAQFVEIGVDRLWQQLDLRDYQSLKPLIQEYTRLSARLAGGTAQAPAINQDDELARKCQRRIEKGLGLKREEEKIDPAS